MEIHRTSTGYAGKINSAPFTVTMKDGQQIIEGKPGFFLNEGEMRQITKEIRKSEVAPLFWEPPVKKVANA